MLRILVAIVVTALWMPLAIFLTDGKEGTHAAIWLAEFTIPVTLAITVPAVIWWRKRITLKGCVLTGAAVGLIAVLAFLFLTNVFVAFIGAPRLILAGMLSGLAFWILGACRNRALTVDEQSRACDAAI